MNMYLTRMLTGLGAYLNTYLKSARMNMYLSRMLTGRARGGPPPSFPKGGGGSRHVGGGLLPLPGRGEGPVALRTTNRDLSDNLCEIRIIKVTDLKS